MDEPAAALALYWLRCGCLTVYTWPRPAPRRDVGAVLACGRHGPQFVADVVLDPTNETENSS